ELAPGLLVHLLLGQELQRATEREQRRAQLVGGVRDELAPGVLELREAPAHPVEGKRELTELVVVPVGDGLVEAAAGDPVGSPLQAADTPGEQARAAVADQERRNQRDPAGQENAPPDEIDVSERVVQRGGEQNDRPAVVDRNRNLHPPFAAPRQRAVGAARTRRRLLRDRIVL